MTSRPHTRPVREKRAEDRYDFTVVFTDDAEPITITDVEQSGVDSVYRSIGDPEGYVRLQTQPGFFYMTSTRRIKYITAALITESSN